MDTVSVKYKWDPEGYSQHSKSQLKWACELIAKLKLNGNERILDIGCGDGKVTKLISEAVPEGEVIGIDSSQEMVEFASSKYPTSEYKNLKFINMDATKIDFQQYFDVVFSNAALHWIIDHRPVLNGIYKALKPSGKVLVQMGGKGNTASVVEILNKLSNHERWRQYFINFSFPYGFYAPSEYKKWLEEAGFRIKRIELISKDRVHNDIDEFKGWIRTQWLPYTSRIPVSEREKYVDMVALEYVKNHPSKNGKFVVKMQRLEYEAIKL